VLKTNNKRDYLQFILPAILFVFVFTLYPSLHTIFLSFTGNTIKADSSFFVGFKNYYYLLTDPDFINSALRTFIYVFITIAFQLAIGLSLALITNNNLKGKSIVRTAVLISWVIPEVIVALVFKWMFLGDQFGIINAIVINSGLSDKPVEWLSNGTLTMTVAIGMTVWRGIAFSMIMQTAGLQSIPDSLYESSDIDGATGTQKFIYITLPLLKSSILINLIIITIQTFNVMSLIYAFSGGNPFRQTEILSIFMYKTAFQLHKFGSAASIAVLMLILNCCLVAVYMKYIGPKEK
jgi:multiple sugar transport system permease protein